LAWGKKDKDKNKESTPEQSPPPFDPAVQKKVLELISLIEMKPTGVFVNNQGRVEVPPNHQPYNPDGSRNQDFTVTHDTPSGGAIMVNHEQKRQQAVRDLIAIGRPAVDELARALTREYMTYRSLYAYALGEIRDPRAVPALLKYLEDGQEKLKNVPFVRENGDPAFAEQLEASGNKMIQDAGEALSKITGQNYGPDLAKWKEWWEANKDRVGPTPNLIEYTANPPSSQPPVHYDKDLANP
jgi:hypothetical protein